MEQPAEQSRTIADGATGGQPSWQGPVASRALYRVGILAAALIGALAGGGLLHFAWERPALEAAHARAQEYEQELAALRGHLQESRRRAAALEGHLLVEESTRRGLETTLRTLQDELGRAQDTLAFYEQLMPPGPEGALTIRALDIEQVGPHLKYRLLLMRSGSNNKPFQGSLQFLAKGQANDEEVTVPLSPIVVQTTQDGQGERQSEAAADPDRRSAALADEPQNAGPGESGAEFLAVEFADFQRRGGLLGLPPGFEPESVTVNVLEGRTLRSSRSVTLRAADE